jgi:ABC-type glutathione transport system ATPase component
MTEYIEIRGARENNLKDITLRIPKRQITIFTGVSGSGKSSIVFDTIATEAGAAQQVPRAHRGDCPGLMAHHYGPDETLRRSLQPERPARSSANKKRI